MSIWGTVADWIVAGGTLVVASVAVFQETIHGWFYHPSFEVSARTEPPDCVSVPLIGPNGTFISSIYLRLWIKNAGNATAKNVEVYAKELHRQRMDKTWERISPFPPMNLRWANFGNTMYFPRIAPDMGKHCDLGHIVDPSQRHLINEDNSRLRLNSKQTSLAFDLMAAPNHRGHIIGPGEYRLDILVSAENARPLRRTVSLSLLGSWDADETSMLRDGVGISVT